MWIVRRRVELLLIGIGIAVVVFGGLTLPPPVGRSFEARGQVSALVKTRRHMDFRVRGSHFGEANGAPGWKKLRSTVRNGLSVRVEGWRPFLADDDGIAAILQLETEAGPLLSRGVRLRFDWVLHAIVLALGLMMAGIGVNALRHPRSLAERVPNLEPSQPLLPQSIRRRHHKRGAQLSIGGLVLVVSPLLFALLGTLRGSAGLFFIVVAFAGVYLLSAGGHRLLFGRPLTGHDTISRRVVYALLATLFALSTFLFLAGILAPWF